MVTSYLWLAVCVVAVADALTSLPSAKALDVKQIGPVKTSGEPTGRQQRPREIPRRHGAGVRSHHPSGRYLPRRPLSFKDRFCNFEYDLCSWEQSTLDDFDWSRRNQYATRRSRGYYLTTSDVFLKHPGKAWLNSPLFNLNVPVVCLTFYYHMRGPGATDLNVYMRRGSRFGPPVFAVSGDQGKAWIKAYVEITCHRSYVVVIEATRASGRIVSGGISIDNVRLTEGSCQAVLHGLCAFNTDLCMWEQDTTDDFDWTRIKGPTPSHWTGPKADHTWSMRPWIDQSHAFAFSLDSKRVGYYLYIETSKPGRQPDDKARLISMEMAPSHLCMIFYYHMYGATIGHLKVYTRWGFIVNSPVHTISGEQGNLWHKAQVDINSTKPFRVVIEATHGDGRFGDIAIDDVFFREGSC